VWRSLETKSASALPRLKPTIGLAASLLAAWCQILLLATIALAPLATRADPVAYAPICHGDDGTQPSQDQPNQPTHDCTLCVLCLAQASPLAVLSTTPALPARRSIAVIRLDVAQPRAPPIRLVAAAQPRGPPALT